MSRRIDVQYANGTESTPDKGDIEHWVAGSIAAVDGDAGLAVAVRIVDADEMQSLYRDFGGQDKSTNVLSFPAGTIAGLPAEAEVPLGDVVICASVVNAEALQQGKRPQDHWAHMVVHGTLHLLGYDHLEAGDATVMETLEAEILAGFGIDNPYGESPFKN